MKNKSGRPPIWKDPKNLQKLIDKYFEDDDKPTLAGLAVYLDIDRQTLYNYAKRDMFFDTIKKAREKVKAIYEKRLVYEGYATGVIFALKNMGWKDRIDHTTDDKPLPKPILGGISVSANDSNKENSKS